MSDRLLTTRELASIAWAAGLFEGEGSILCPSGHYQRLRLGMTDEDVVRRFQAIAGCGTVRRAQPRAAGWRPLFVWQVSDRGNVSRLLGLWLPYFGGRRAERAVEALERISRQVDGQGRLL